MTSATLGRYKGNFTISLTLHTHSLTHSLSHSLSRSQIHTLINTHTHSQLHTLTHSLANTHTLTLSHSNTIFFSSPPVGESERIALLSLSVCVFSSNSVPLPNKNYSFLRQLVPVLWKKERRKIKRWKIPTELLSVADVLPLNLDRVTLVRFF